MTFEELQANKVANDGENAQGQLSADEYNTLLERVQELSQPGHGEIQIRPGQRGGIVKISVIDGVVNVTRDDANIAVPQGSVRVIINNPTIEMDTDWTSFDFIPRPISVMAYLSDTRIPMQTSGVVNVQFMMAGRANYTPQPNLYVEDPTSAYYATGTVIITLYPLPGRQVAYTFAQAYNN